MTIEYFPEEDLSEDYNSKRDENTITESDLKSFFKCPHSYHLKNNMGYSHIPKSGFAALAMFFENARRGLYKIRDPSVGRIFPWQNRAGSELKLAEEMDASELREYLAYGENKFGNLLFSRWLQITKDEKYIDSELAWSFKSQRFNEGKELKEAGDNYYQFVLDKGAPIFGYINKDISFEFEGHKIKIKFPELRKGMTIDDIGLWGFNSTEPDNKEIKLEESVLTTKDTNFNDSLLVTLRILGYCTLATKHDFYRRKWGIPDEIAEEWEAKKVHISDKVRYRHFNAIENKITETRRSESDIDSLKRGLEIFLNFCEKENFPVNHSSCNACGYNVVDLKGKVVCRDRKLSSKPSVPLYYFKKSAFEIKMSEEDSRIELSGFIRKNEEILKPVNSFILEYDCEGKVNSSYFSEIRGLGFEDKLLMNMDQRLIELSSKLEKKLIHTIDFEKNFKGSGQEKVKETLRNIGYEGTPKTGYTKNYSSSSLGRV